MSFNIKLDVEGFGQIALTIKSNCEVNHLLELTEHFITSDSKTTNTEQKAIQLRRFLMDKDL